MKKISNVIKTLLALFIFLNFQNLSAASTWFSKNKTYSDEIKFKGITYELLEGEWTFVSKFDWPNIIEKYKKILS